MKKVLFSVFLLLCMLLPCIAEAYKINDVDYETKGITRTYALSQKVPVNTRTIFEDRESFDKYIAELKQKLTNQRVFQSSDIECIFLEESSEGYIPVNLIISTVDTLNIIGVPYPSYDSNTGFTLKLKVKDYNFLGSMETMDFDLNYQAEGTDDLDDVKHIYGLNFGFSIPFKFISIPASWDSNFGFEYTIGDSQIDMEICEGISFDIPISDITKAHFGFNQFYIQDSDYIESHDNRYFKEELSLSFPFKLTHLAYFDDILWAPGFEYTYIWDFDAFDHTSNSGIVEEKLRSPELVFLQTFSAGRINWISNFRDGFEGALQHSFGYNFSKCDYLSSITFSSQFHKKLNSFIGFSSREYFNYDFYGVKHKFGSMVRGIRDNDFKSSSYLLLNLDLLVSLFHTNWGNLFGWDKLNFFNFEFQFSPFQDIVLGKNTYSGTTFNPKDGWYGTGFEMIVFPDRFRSIQGRISFGVDTVQFLNKAGKKIDSIGNVADNLFNSDWRSSSSGWYELSIGIGLFY